MIHDASVQFRYEIPTTTNDADRETIRETIKVAIQAAAPKSVRDAWAHFPLMLSGTEAAKHAQWEIALDQFVADWYAATGVANSYDKSSIEVTYWVEDSEIVCQHHYLINPGGPGPWTIVVDLDEDATIEIRLAIAIHTPCT